jgi:hypothetical protein
MRVLMRAEFDTEAGNRAIKDGRLPKVLNATLERLKPEAAYFTAIGGQRGAFIVFDLEDPSDIPVIAEPLFMEMGAKIELIPVMSADDIQSGLPSGKRRAAPESYRGWWRRTLPLGSARNWSMRLWKASRAGARRRGRQGVRRSTVAPTRRVSTASSHPRRRQVWLVSSPVASRWMAADRRRKSRITWSCSLV